MNNYIIKNAIIFTVNSNDQVISSGAVVIQKGMITYVGPSESIQIPFSDMPVIDVKGLVTAQ